MDMNSAIAQKKTTIEASSIGDEYTPICLSCNEPGDNLALTDDSQMIKIFSLENYSCLTSWGSDVLMKPYGICHIFQDRLAITDSELHHIAVHDINGQVSLTISFKREKYNLLGDGEGELECPLSIFNPPSYGHSEEVLTLANKLKY